MFQHCSLGAEKPFFERFPLHWPSHVCMKVHCRILSSTLWLVPLLYSSKTMISSCLNQCAFLPHPTNHRCLSEFLHSFLWSFWVWFFKPRSESSHSGGEVPLNPGRVAKLVSRPLSMRKVPGSKPGMSIFFFVFRVCPQNKFSFKKKSKK